MYRCSNTHFLQKLLLHSSKTFSLLNKFSAVAARADSSYTYSDEETQYLDKDRNFTHGYQLIPNGVQRETQVVYKDHYFSNGYAPISTNGGSQQNSTVGIHGRSSGESRHSLSGQDWSFSNGYTQNSIDGDVYPGGGVSQQYSTVGSRGRSSGESGHSLSGQDWSSSNGCTQNSIDGGVSQQNSTVGSHGSYSVDQHSQRSTLGVQTNQETGLSANNVGEFNKNASGNVQGGASLSLMPANGKLVNQSGKVEVIEFLGTIEELDGYCEEKKMEEAVEVLKILENRGIGLDVERYLLLIRLCKEAGEFKYAKFVHNHIMRGRGRIIVSDHNKILEMYFKCGYISDAREMFEKMPERNLTTWDTMISNLARNGYGEDALDVFTQFIKAGLRPDGQMYIGVFLACSVVCDVYEGMFHFESMNREYGIVPSMEHYVGVVNMLGSTGYLDEAKEFIENMSVAESVEIWETLMNVCIVHGNTELGNHCTEIVNFLDPTCLTKESKLGLLPVKSSSLVTAEVKEKTNSLHDIVSKTQQYRAGDNFLPENRMDYVILKQLSVHMKEAGYVPFTKVALHDIEEESKEEHLLGHSEKLAAVHGFMTSPARGTLRILKNLRICMDCHNGMKLMSKIVGREMIVRDTKRFHHFKDGACSCRDFW